MKKKDIWAEFSDRLVNALERKPRGEGWLTVEEMAERLGMKINGVKSMIKIRRSMFEIFDGRRLAPNGKVLPKKWYRPRQG